MELMLCRAGGSESRRYALADGETVVGRRPDCRIVLDAPSISPRHARLFSVDGHAVIYAIDDAWPVYVNGKPVKRHDLVNGDDIELGHYRMRYVDKSTTGDDIRALSGAGTDTAGADEEAFQAAPAAAAENLDNAAPRDPPAPTAPEALDEEPPIVFHPAPASGPIAAAQSSDDRERETAPEEAGAVSSPGYHLDILTGINQGRRIALTHDVVVLGFNRQRLVEIQKNDDALSLRLIDEEAAAALNGTPITDAPVEAGPGDVISLQRIELRIHSDAG